MFLQYCCISFFVLLLTPRDSFCKFCDPVHYDYASNTVGDKNGFNYYPWTIFERPIIEKIHYIKITSEVEEICRNSLPRNIQEAILANISLTYLQPGVFHGTPQLQNVDLQENNLKMIENGVFTSTNIVTLILSENQIETIHPQAFDNMTKLEAISLDYNKIKIWDVNWFTNTQILYEISISHNQLKELPQGVTKNLKQMYEKPPYFVFGGINFDNNEIKYIHPDAFEGTTKLSFVSLSNNKLFEIPEKVFKNFTYLLTLYLNTNKFICMGDKTLESLKNVNRIFLGMNSLNLDCKENIRKFFESRNSVAYF